ncbi:MAG: hypothetical protein IBX62_01540 [Coriobacteriia bacterium]|nr:hypothetical protein [Coriobacteriia bacterium]
MGRNPAIKRYRTHTRGQSADLFGDKRGRLPVVMELLRSPWVVRGSELPGCDGAAPGKRVEREVEVEWDGERRVPAMFSWGGRRYRVDALAQAWAVERAWWDPRERVSRRCFRVLARGGVYDLAYDRLTNRWLLVGIVD